MPTGSAPIGAVNRQKVQGVAGSLAPTDGLAGKREEGAERSGWDFQVGSSALDLLSDILFCLPLFLLTGFLFDNFVGC